MSESQFLAVMGAFITVVAPLIIMGVKYGRLTQKVLDLETAIKKIDSIGNLTAKADTLNEKAEALFKRTDENRSRCENLQRQIDRCGRGG